MIINNFQSLIRRIDWVSSWTLFDAPGFTLWRSRHFNLKSSKWETPRLLQAYKKLIQVSYKLVQKQSRSVSNFDTVDAFGQFILMFRLICDAFQGGRQLTIVFNESFQVSGSSWSYFLDIHWFERVQFMVELLHLHGADLLPAYWVSVWVSEHTDQTCGLTRRFSVE